jgi:UDP-N-acetylmuramoylalanine--D-glutamate ligase
MWINDSIATSPERVIAALNSFSEPIVLLAGGRDKKLPWDEFAVMAAQRCKALVCFGEHGPAIAEHVRRVKGMLSHSTLKTIKVVNTLGKAVETAAHELAAPGDVVLLSPGATSYDAYQDFEERGEHFRELVKSLPKKRL